MGDFRIEIQAVGGHGCQRDRRSGDVIEECSDPNCPDCLTRRFLKQLRDAGCSVSQALVIHWPNSQHVSTDGRSSTIIDNLLSKQRSGTF